MTRRAGHHASGVGGVIVATAALLCPSCGTGPAEAQAALATYRFDIAAQPLATALAEFATVSGVDIAYRQSLAATRRSSAVRGNFPAPVALRLLLERTGLAARFTGPRAAIIFEPGAIDVVTPRRGTSTAPSLRLDMAEVRAPIMVGAPDRAGHRQYALAALGEIRDWLRADGGYQGHASRLEIRLTVDHSGVIRQVAIRRRSAEPGWDAHVVRTLTGRALSRPPPSDLSEPLAFEIVSDRLADRSPRP